MTQKITVYHYWTWIPHEGLGKIPCRKRTQQQIEQISGIPIRVTREDVDEADLASDGSYKPERPDGSQDIAQIPRPRSKMPL